MARDTLAQKSVIQFGCPWSADGGVTYTLRLIYLYRKMSNEFKQNLKYDEEDVVTWMACDAEDCGFQMLNDDEIVTSVQEESDPVSDEMDEDEDNNNNNESSKGPSNADAFSALETAM
ncbi:uncharacterized protein TNCV_1670561 [Trichonephila clavipes]|nr:uncharacterized protein TNCV_1670561 [Trichonephila clavipes]